MTLTVLIVIFAIDSSQAGIGGGRSITTEGVAMQEFTTMNKCLTAAGEVQRRAAYVKTVCVPK